MRDETLPAMCLAAALVLIIGGAALYSYSETIKVPSQSPFRLYEETTIYPYRGQGVLSLLAGASLLVAAFTGFVVSRGVPE